VFHIFDADKSNDLDIEELIPALTATLGKRITRQETEKIMRIYDTDENFRLDEKEFCALVSAMRKQMKTTKAKLARYKVSSRSNKKATKEARELGLEKVKLQQLEQLEQLGALTATTTTKPNKNQNKGTPDFTKMQGNWHQVGTENLDPFLKDQGVPWPIRKLIKAQKPTQALTFSETTFDMVTETKKMGPKGSKGEWGVEQASNNPRGQGGVLKVWYELGNGGVDVENNLNEDRGPKIFHRFIKNGEGEDEASLGSRHINEKGQLVLTMGPSPSKKNKGEMVQATRIFERD
tara:strand:- start:19 stop:894 length:876 start_codon:yes stop_codon:yes gene_type:complete